jgi:hypothetical protein
LRSSEGYLKGPSVRSLPSLVKMFPHAGGGVSVGPKVCLFVGEIGSLVGVFVSEVGFLVGVFVGEVGLLVGLTGCLVGITTG